MSTQRLNNQLRLFDEASEVAFGLGNEGEARGAEYQGVEVRRVKEETEDPTPTESLMESICREENIEAAIRHVSKNAGSPGVDGMTTVELPRYMRRHWSQLREELLSGRYQPQAVKRVVIEKAGGGERVLGIPTVVDRVIQQAVLQLLQPQWDATFHENSYGYRPGRSAHQAVKQAHAYVNEGYEYVVDIDLEQFFDRVNHDVLMSRVARRIEDKRVLKLIRGYLTAGIMEGGVSSPRSEGTPQGGPLSPLLSNLLLDELDQELQRRGHKFVRYADDCNIYVKSERSGLRVMSSVEEFLRKRLRLRVNHAKSGVAKVWERDFLGFRFWHGLKRIIIMIAPKSKARFRQKVRKLTKRSRGRSLSTVITEVSQYLRGWKQYFRMSQSMSDFEKLDGWIRRRLRSYLWKQWKHHRGRISALWKRGIAFWDAVWFTRRSQGNWRTSRTTVMSRALPSSYFDELGLMRLAST